MPEAARHRLACSFRAGNPPDGTFERIAYVACGELTMKCSSYAPDLPENNIPTFSHREFQLWRHHKDRGKGFMRARELSNSGGSTGCLTFAKAPNVKNGGTMLIQKGKAHHGRKLKPDSKRAEDRLFRHSQSEWGRAIVLILHEFACDRSCQR